MLEILKFYVSSFWVWAGITVGLSLVIKGVWGLFVGGIGAWRGTTVHIGDVTHEKDDT